MKLIIDESVSNRNLEVFDALAKKTGISVDSRVFLKESHPGIPDSQVIQHLLNSETIFVTTDRPFHNKVILAGLRSYYVESGKITSKALRGIKVDSSKFVSRKDTVLRSSYHQPKTEIRGLILPTGDQKLKRLSTKRRRIRSHFGGLDNLAEIAVTVSYSPLRTGILIGIKIRVSSNVGIKALDASENYVFEKPNSN